ncbi:MAG: protein of unknown function transrane [Cohnella sp.]|jgi:drug/metabolite transporter (DMT)-like permease|nr:protein of unknown function transrane [Cohnella sp.]
MNKILGALYLMTAAALWGGSQVFSKYVMAEVHPMTLAFMRFLLAVIVLAIAVFLKNPVRIMKKDILKIAMLGFLGYTISIGSQLVGIRLSSAHQIRYYATP